MGINQRNLIESKVQRRLGLEMTCKVRPGQSGGIWPLKEEMRWSGADEECFQGNEGSLWWEDRLQGQTRARAYRFL